MLDVVQLTSFGAIFLVVALCILGWRRDWLPALLIVAAVLQAPAVVTVGIGTGRFGVTPFNVASALIALAIAIDGWQAKRLPRVPPTLRQAYLWWSMFLAYAVAAALVLPHLFAGVPVHPLIALSDIAPDPVPNHWSISHLAQAINSAALWVLFTYVVVQHDRKRTCRIFAAGFVAALFVAVAVGLYQRAAMLGMVELHAGFWGSNPGYNQFFLTPEYGPAIGRVGLPFAEPSYASVWFAAAVAGALTALLYGDRAHRGLAVAAATAAMIGLINTIGTSGIVALTVFGGLLAVFHMRWGRRAASGGPFVATMLALLGAGGIVVLLDYAWWQSTPLAPVRDSIDWTLQKFASYASGVRLLSNLRALEITIETYGLGVGPGSTRASSYLLSLLANAGVAGLLLFAIALGVQLRALVRSRNAHPTHAWGLLGAIICALIGVAGGIPDQNWPILWILLLGAFALTAAAEQDAAARFDS